MIYNEIMKVHLLYFQFVVLLCEADPYIFLHISSSYAKILGETNFRTQEFSRSGSKAEDGEKERERERKRERAKVGDNNGQATHGARKHAWHTQAAWANIL